MTKAHICLRSVDARWDGQTWESNRLLRVGRLKEQEIVFDESSVSRQHAEAVFTEQGWIVRDLGSTNGTYLNGVRIGRAERLLREGDVLQCGNVALIVAILRGETPSMSLRQDNRIQVRQSVQLAWEDIPRVLATGPGRRGPSNRLLTLIQIGRNFSPAQTLEDYLETLLWETAELFEAQRGAVVLHNELSGQLAARALFHFAGHGTAEKGEFEGLAEQALNCRESLLLEQTGPPDAAGHPDMQSVLGAVLRSAGKQLGVLLLARPANKGRFDQTDLEWADALALTVAPSLESLELLFQKKQELLFQTLTTLAQTVDLRDDYTGGHTQRVTDYALMLAEEMKLSPLQRHYLQVGTPLHDLGKIGISDATLRKPGALSSEELKDMRSHVIKGVALLESIPGLDPFLPIIRSHHERWDGTGYPDGLHGEQIPLLGRIVAVADAFDAMTTDRPYRPGLSLTKAFAELQSKAGHQFDPACIEAFLNLRARLETLFAQRNFQNCTLSIKEINETKEALQLGRRSTLHPAGDKNRPTAVL